MFPSDLVQELLLETRTDEDEELPICWFSLDGIAVRVKIAKDALGC